MKDEQVLWKLFPKNASIYLINRLQSDFDECMMKLDRKEVVVTIPGQLYFAVLSILSGG